MHECPGHIRLNEKDGNTEHIQTAAEHCRQTAEYAGGALSCIGLGTAAFLAGLVLNRLIPRVSPLMHHLEFVGNALFIPYFLIGVGMLIDVRVFFGHVESMKVAGVMIVMALITKWIAAFLTQKICRLEKIERELIFGLSNAQAAATLAAVLVGYNIILDNGERLLNDDVLNGTIVLILVTCVVSSFMTERAAKKLAMAEADKTDDISQKEEKERILISVGNPETINYLVSLALVIRDSRQKNNLYALNVINDNNTDSRLRQGKMSLEKAGRIASAVDVPLQLLSRYDLNIASGIVHTQKEIEATDVIIGLHRKSNIIDSFLGNLTETLLTEISREIIIVKMLMPLNTIRRIVVAVPPNAEYESGFSKWVRQMGKLSSELGCRIYFHAAAQTLEYIRRLLGSKAASDTVRLNLMESWDDLLLLSTEVNYDHLLVIVSARRGTMSYLSSFEHLASQISRYFANTSLMVVYPDQLGEGHELPAITNPLSGSVNPRISVVYAHVKKQWRIFRQWYGKKNSN